MDKYRIYAKILGPVLPKKETPYGECFIKRMSRSEQKKRGFRPLEAEISDQREKSYLTHKRLSDPRIIKTDYVIYTDIEADYFSELIFKSVIERFDNVTGVLAMAASMHYSRKYKIKARYQHYEYQISKIYKLVEGKESKTKIPIRLGGSSSLINLPSENDMTVLNDRLVQRMLNSKDDIFWKSLIHLQSGEKGFHNNTPSQMMTLDFMKSIELIVKCFHPSERFNRKSFYEVAKFLGVDEADKDQIWKLWKLRSEGDIAHAKRGMGHINPYIDSSSLAVRFLSKYFLFRDSLIHIKITKDHSYESNELVEVSHIGGAPVFVIRPTKRERISLTPFLKRKISEHFDIPIRKIKIVAYQLPDIYFQIVDYLDFDFESRKMPHKRIVLFGRI